ncbi:WYL domain-containing protein [Christensenellaceae bacterium OttesenSCG-928-K19]|nr:WYL domain-containing protein [Christensenellaceae bacterium OttesenSCG-928-K19]
MDSGTSVERQLYILSLLAQSARGYTLQEIINQLQRSGIEATRRMVTRDLDSISRNFFVYEEEQGGKTVYKADKYAVSSMDFTMPQMISLYYVKEMLKADRPHGVAKEAADIIDTILGQMPALSQAALAEVEKMIKVVPLTGTGEQDLDAAVLEEVQRAARDCKSIEVLYTSFSSGETQKRLFDPYVLEVRDGCWHVIGHCHLRGSVRDLRISRIKEAGLTKKGFTVPVGFYEQYRRTRFDKMAGEELQEVEVEFTGTAARLIAEYHADKADSIKQEDGRLLFYKKTALMPDLVQWLLSFGPEAKVLKPARLADDILKQAQEIAGLYSKQDGI